MEPLVGHAVPGTATMAVGSQSPWQRYLVPGSTSADPLPPWRGWRWSHLWDTRYQVPPRWPSAASRRGSGTWYRVPPRLTHCLLGAAGDGATWGTRGTRYRHDGRRQPVAVAAVPGTGFHLG